MERLMPISISAKIFEEGMSETECNTQVCENFLNYIKEMKGEELA